METNSYTCKIPITGSKSVCILNSEWLTSEINLLLLHDNQAWSGKFQLTENDSISDLLDQLSLSRDMYIEESRKALITHNGADNFTYSLENEKFFWKKNVRKNMSVKFGNVNLLKIPLFEAFEKVLENTLHSNLTLSTKLQNNENQRRILEKENNILNSKLNEIVGKKNEMEETLYSQFLHLLNEKKRKIKELKEKMPAGDNEVFSDSLQYDESDHFGSDTEIDSEEEENILASKSYFGGSCVVKKELSPLPKRSRQKRPNESIAGPSGENSKAKNSKVVHKKKQTVNRKGQKKTTKDSCVIGQKPEESNKNLSETPEDLFMFQKQSKRNLNITQTVKPFTSKIIYESDEETDLKNIEQMESDTDKTPSVIDQVDNLNEKKIYLELTESSKTKHDNLKQGIGGEKVENNGHEDQKDSVVKKSSSRGISSSVLSILNDLM